MSMKDAFESKTVINNQMNNDTSIKQTIKIPLNMENKCIDVIEKYYENEVVILNIKLSQDSIKVFYDNAIIASSKDYSFKEEKSFKYECKMEQGKIDDINLVIDIDQELFKNFINAFDSDLMDYAISLGYDTERLDYLKEYKISSNVLKNILKNFDAKNDVPKPDILFYDGTGLVMKIAIIKAAMGGSLRLVGPKSTGKNTMADTIAWLLGRKTIKFPGSPYTDKSDLLGDVELKPIVDDRGETHIITEFQERALVTAMKEGCILLMDEININNPATLALLHGPLDNSRCITINTQETVYADKKFLCIATMNEGYKGTATLNSALVDRMCPIYFDYVPKVSEIISIIRPEVNKDDLNYIDNMNKKIQRLADADELVENDPCSIRGWLDYLDLIVEGISKKDAFVTGIINRLQDKNDRKKLKEIINIC